MRAPARLARVVLGYRYILAEHVPDHTVIARLRQRHVERLQAVFGTVLRMCRDAGLIRLGLAVLDCTKVKTNASLEVSTPEQKYIDAARQTGRFIEGFCLRRLHSGGTGGS